MNLLSYLGKYINVVFCYSLMIVETLQELGLSQAEARVYIALIELGSSATGGIIKTTQLQSSTVYRTLDMLAEKGLISHILVGKIKIYNAEAPDSLTRLLEEKKRKLDAVMPELKLKDGLRDKHLSAKVYHGIRGLKAAYEDILEVLETGEEYYFFQFEKSQLDKEQIQRFYASYHRRRSARGIKVKGLALKNAQRLVKEIYAVPHTQIRYLDEFLPTGMVIYKNKVIIIEWEDAPVAFVIESASVADSYERFFLARWRRATPL